MDETGRKSVLDSSINKKKPTLNDLGATTNNNNDSSTPKANKQ